MTAPPGHDGRRGLSLQLLTITPFESAVAALLIITGASGLGHYRTIDPVTALLPGWEAILLSVMCVLTGGLLLAGTGIPHRAAETAGLLFLIGVVASRFLLYGAYLGYGSGFAVTGVFYLTLVWAALARLLTISRGQVVVRIGGPPGG
jgi:hypothetical protein